MRQVYIYMALLGTLGACMSAIAYSMGAGPGSLRFLGLSTIVASLGLMGLWGNFRR